MFFPHHWFCIAGGGLFDVYLNQQYKKQYYLYFRLSLHANSNIRALTAFQWEQNLRLMLAGDDRCAKATNLIVYFFSYTCYILEEQTAV
jgi:hypothetical protein